MSNFKIQVPSINDVDQKSQTIFNTLNQQLGMLPNLYATIGYSSDTLENFLAFSSKAGKSSFTNKEIEAIKLVVSEVNGCQYCLAAHTALGKMAGLSESETIDLRSGQHQDSRLESLVALAKDIASNKGKPSESSITRFFGQGFDEKALIDLVATVTAITFTNFAHGTTRVPIDFPKAKSLQKTELVA